MKESRKARATRFRSKPLTAAAAAAAGVLLASSSAILVSADSVPRGVSSKGGSMPYYKSKECPANHLLNSGQTRRYISQDQGIDGSASTRERRSRLARSMTTIVIAKMAAMSQEHLPVATADSTVPMKATFLPTSSQAG